MRLSSCLLALAPMAVPAAAQQAPSKYQPSAEFQRCMKQDDAAKGIATAVDLCINSEQVAQQERLGLSYDRAFAALTGWDQVRLFNDQTEWREGLDERCALASSDQDNGGTSSRAFNLCRAEEMANRAAWLDDYQPE